MIRRDSRHITWKQRWVYNALRVTARVSTVGLFRIRCRGRHHIPSQGAVLVCSNHQSSFDPVLVGLACDRRLNYLARKTLFEVPVLAPLIRFLDAIPVDRDGGGASGFKETMRRLRGGEMVLVFPEGTRTQDGLVAAFKPGVTVLARRARTPILPVAIDGAFQCLPRSKRWPFLLPIQVHFGPVLTTSQCDQWDDAQLVAEIHGHIQRLHQSANAARRRTFQELA